ncbi:hypothetical protein JTB14_029729 [Gonioctena quinquepunctata]|nr:hypothetical protein JTB14_029729 [Gonioctena quinquepunctata]
MGNKPEWSLGTPEEDYIAKKEFEKQALKIHGLYFNDDGLSSGSDSGKSSFDEEYHQYKPQPIQIDINQLIVIENPHVLRQQLNVKMKIEKHHGTCLQSTDEKNAVGNIETDEASGITIKTGGEKKEENSSNSFALHNSSIIPENIIIKKNSWQQNSQQRLFPSSSGTFANDFHEIKSIALDKNMQPQKSSIGSDIDNATLPDNKNMRPNLTSYNTFDTITTRNSAEQDTSKNYASSYLNNISRNVIHAESSVERNLEKKSNIPHNLSMIYYPLICLGQYLMEEIPTLTKKTGLNV